MMIDTYQTTQRFIRNYAANIMDGRLIEVELHILFETPRRLIIHTNFYHVLEPIPVLHYKQYTITIFTPKLILKPRQFSLENYNYS